MAKKEKIQYPNPEFFRCKDEIKLESAVGEPQGSRHHSMGHAQGYRLEAVRA